MICNPFYIPGQKPVVAAFINSLLLGVSTSVAISVREAVDTKNSSLSNFIFFVVISSVHFAVLTTLGLVFGFGGGMIAMYPAKKISDRLLWWAKGEAAFEGDTERSSSLMQF
tara:strand:- start:303 stop:638 length:336 start_codon:yes stop_codon:yes gene_type:complete